MTPSNQKDIPISFMLWDNQASISLAQAGLVIRPEELSKSDPSRNNDTQTLGGAWVDSHGEGLSTLTLSGHTGWRGTADKDGLALFKQLHDSVFREWHQMRRNNVNNGVDPDYIELIFADKMDDITVVVSPNQFQLRRHKTRPLLSQFNINMTVIRDASENAITEIDKITAAINSPRGRYRATKDSMNATIKDQQAWSAKVDQTLGFSMSGFAKDVLDTSTRLLQAVQAVVDTASGYIDATLAPLMYMATAYQQAARNVFQILAMPANLAAQVKGSLMSIASTLNDAYCLLVNGFGILTRFPDFSDIFGASTCSSTGGGRPISPRSGENPFLSMYPKDNNSVSVTEEASNAAETLRQTDPLSLSAADVPVLAQTMANGVNVVLQA